MLLNVLELVIINLIISSTVSSKSAVSLDRNSPPPLIPRSKLFKDSDKESVSLSPDGHFIAYLAPYNGVQNIWIQQLDHALDKSPIARPVTNNKGHGIFAFHWTYLPGILVFTQANDWDVNWRFSKLNVTPDYSQPEVLSYTNGLHAVVLTTSKDYPDTIMIGINNRDTSFYDVYSLNLITGEKKLIYNNLKEFILFFFDNDMRLRLASKENDKGDLEYYKAILSVDKNSITDWVFYRFVPMEDSTIDLFIGFDKHNDNVYWINAEQSDFGVLFLRSLENFENKTTIYVFQKSQILKLEPFLHVAFHPTDHTILFLEENYLRSTVIVLNETVQSDIDYLKAHEKDGDFMVIEFSTSFDKWLISYVFDNKPEKYYIYDRSIRIASYLFTTRPHLDIDYLSNMHGFEILTRDNKTMPCYLSLPVESDPQALGRPLRPLPMVLYVHGGPWLRDFWKLSVPAQFFTNRGYAVLQCNYRGSIGFGRSHYVGGFGEFGGKIHDDLIDAVNWAIAQNVAIRDKIAIDGFSYGGYAALVGLTFTPNVFACGVDMCGMSNLVTSLEIFPPNWPHAHWTKRVGGDPKTTEGRQFLKSRSPLTFANRVVRPLLIGHGANDPVLNRYESDQMYEALKKSKFPVKYILYNNEGHGFLRTENMIAYRAIEEEFLSHCLGGRFEPMTDEIEISKVRIFENINDS